MKKEAKLSAREMPGVQEGKGEDDLRCKSFFTVCHRRLLLSEDEETVRVEVFLGCKNEVVVLVAQRLEGGPVDSRVSAFPEVLSVANRRPEGS